MQCFNFIQTHCPLITLIFELQYHYILVTWELYRPTITLLLTLTLKVLQAESTLQSMGNAYARLIQEQATIVEASRKRGLKQAERRPVFSLLLFYQTRDESYLPPNSPNAFNDFCT